MKKLVSSWGVVEMYFLFFRFFFSLFAKRDYSAWCHRGEHLDRTRDVSRVTIIFIFVFPTTENSKGNWIARSYLMLKVCTKHPQHIELLLEKMDMQKMYKSREYMAEDTARQLVESTNIISFVELVLVPLGVRYVCVFHARSRVQVH